MHTRTLTQEQAKTSPLARALHAFDHHLLDGSTAATSSSTSSEMWQHSCYFFIAIPLIIFLKIFNFFILPSFR